MACRTTPLFSTGRWLPNWANVVCAVCSNVGGSPNVVSLYPLPHPPASSPLLPKTTASPSSLYRPAPPAVLCACQPRTQPGALPLVLPTSHPFPLHLRFRTYRLPPSIFRPRPLRVSLPFPPPQAWELAYDLAEGTVRPPAKISLPPNVPPPPHLEDCAARTAFRESTEKRAANGESPKWSNSSEACGWVPQPPWVRGPDAGNLAGTRKAQRDLWELQFPASCKERKLLLVEWPPVKGYGLGSQLHIMTSLFSFAVNSNRTFVIKPGSYVRANHSECQALGKAGTFECYFFPMVSKECEDIAMAEHNAGRIPACSGIGGLEHVARSQDLVLCATGYEILKHRSAARCVRVVGACRKSASSLKRCCREEEGRAQV
ncbi:unnamed protein product [Closterium sp. Naga37s-1]|nr:unnamed protein product [Closterium sp. Naga37s-1]